MSNLYALDETIDILNGKDKDYQNHFTNIYDTIANRISIMEFRDSSIFYLRNNLMVCESL